MNYLSHLPRRAFGTRISESDLCALLRAESADAIEIDKMDLAQVSVSLDDANRVIDLSNDALKADAAAGFFGKLKASHRHALLNIIDHATDNLRDLKARSDQLHALQQKNSEEVA